MNTRRPEIAPELVARVGDALSAVEQRLANMHDVIQSATRCCPNCDYFDGQLEKCKLSEPMQRPPARIIAFGCPAFDNKCPF